MSSSKDAALYGAQKPRKIGGGKEISSSTTLSFTSQLSSLITNSASTSSSTTKSRSKHGKKEDIFSKHNRNVSKRAQRDAAGLEDPHAQKHTTNGEALDRNVWERSQRKMEEKARLYAAMKRGDVEDADDKYAVDFDRKWAEKEGENPSEDEEDEDDEGEEEIVTYQDEFGRTRTGTKKDKMREERRIAGLRDVEGDRFTARPVAPETGIIYGDTIQHQAFEPEEDKAEKMEALARKRDRSLTPPEAQHFDSRKEIRRKGTGFFAFSEDVGERERQMEELESERKETERVRGEREKRMEERRREIEKRRGEVRNKRAKRDADEFLEAMAGELGLKQEARTGTEMTDRIEAAVEREKDNDEQG